jgi:hypothetical protein
MKNLSNIMVLVLMIGIILSVTTTGCKKDNNTSPGNDDPGDSGNVGFLAYYEPGTENVLGTEKLIALITVKDGALSYSAFLNVWPESSLLENCDINNNIMVLGLKGSDFDDNGAYMSIDDPSAYYLPLVEATGSGDYSYFQPSTGDVSDNGYIIYSTATNDASYGDEYQPYLLRFNPSDNSTKIAKSPNSFVVGQPEQGSDTEVGQIARTLFASPDGRYAFGSADALGTEGGSIHWDYSILFKYDFDLDEYTRLGATDDNDVSIYGMTSDRRYILYSNHSETRLLDLETGNITTTDMNTVNVKKNAWGLNGACVGTSNGDLIYKDFVHNNEYVVCSSSGYGWLYNTMFSKNDDRIYFLLEGNDKNYLCVTNGIVEGSSYDTISSAPLEFQDMIMIK